MSLFKQNTPEPGVLKDIRRSIHRYKSRNVLVEVDRQGVQCNLLLAARTFFATDGETIDIYAAPLPYRENYRQLYGDDRFSACEISHVQYMS